MVTSELNYGLDNGILARFYFLIFIIVLGLYERMSLPLGNAHLNTSELQKKNLKCVNGSQAYEGINLNAHTCTHMIHTGCKSGVGERVRNHTNYKANWAKEKLLVKLCERIYGVLCATPRNSLSLKLYQYKKKEEVYIHFYKVVCESVFRITGNPLSI